MVSIKRHGIGKQVSIRRGNCRDVAGHFCRISALATIGALVPFFSAAIADQPRFLFGTAKPLAINTPDKPEQTSTISGDGLSVYYVGGDPKVEGATPDVIWATRESDTAPFSNPRPVPGLSGSISAILPTMSGDELTILFRGSDRAFYESTRASTDEAFSSPELVPFGVEDGS